MNSKKLLIVMFILLGIVFSVLAINELVVEKSRVSVYEDRTEANNKISQEIEEGSFATPYLIEIFEDYLTPDNLRVDFGDKVALKNNTKQELTTIIQNTNSERSADYQLRAGESVTLKLEELGEYYYQVINLEQPLEGLEGYIFVERY